MFQMRRVFLVPTLYVLIMFKNKMKNRNYWSVFDFSFFKSTEHEKLFVIRYKLHIFDINFE